MSFAQNNFWQQIAKPIKVLAPMAGYTDSAFRLLCREWGADVVVTELISADAIFHQAKNWFRDDKGNWKSKKGYDETLLMLKFVEAERPVVIQLFGKDPEKFAFAADWLTKNLKPDGIDINMGCPARKVVASGHGSALLKDMPLAINIVESVKQNTDLPVSVKTRLGWENDDQILSVAPELRRAGISAIIIHGRTYKDAFRGSARWSNIYRVKEEMPELIVVGNGDLKENSAFNIQDSILDGFAMGRAAFGKPWIFGQDTIEINELKEVILRHAQLVSQTKGEHGLVEFRKHLLAYLKGFPNARQLRQTAVAVSNLGEVRGIIGNL